MTELIAESKKAQVSIILDSSVLNCFEKCPTLMKYQYIDNLRPRGMKSAALEKGDLIHIPLKHYYAAKKAGKDWEECVKLGYERMLKYSSKLSLDDEARNLVFTTFLSYCEFYRFEKWQIVEIERPFRVVIYEDDELRIIIQGRIDLIVDTGNAIMPVDHKSESRRTEAMALSNQFMCYTSAAKANNLIVNKIGLQATLKPEDKFYRTMLSYDDDNLVEWREELIFKVREMIGYAEVNYFPHRYTSCQDKYGKCIFHGVCHTSRVARHIRLESQFEVVEPWDPFNDPEQDCDDN